MTAALEHPLGVGTGGHRVRPTVCERALEVMG